jgi:nicotinamidase-related amidase
MTQARVWDRFLTDNDKDAVRASSDRRVGFGHRPAVLLIDLYRWVFGDRPQPILEALPEWPGSCGMNGWNALPHIQRLLADARAAGLPVCHVTGLDGAGMPGWSEAIHHEGGRSTGRAVPDQRILRRYDIVPEAAPIEGEVVLRKTAPSAFWGTPLMAELNRLDVDTLIVGGESTSGCVRASVVDAASYRFRVIVVEECVFDRHEAPHAINLFDMHQKYADVLPLDEVLAHLSRGAVAMAQQVASRAAAMT